MKKSIRLLLPTCTAATLLACGASPVPDRQATSHQPTVAAAPSTPDDPHSLSNPEAVVVRHVHLDLRADFANRRLVGRATLEIARRDGADHLDLDTMGLTIERVQLDDGAPAGFELGAADPVLGRRLRIPVQSQTRFVHIDYTTGPDSAALQWLEPRQTAAGSHPFLFTQAQPILARSWFPCQDTPAVRFTYSARITVPPQLRAVMSAENPLERTADGVYEFRMRQPIPSYLVALAVGDLAFAQLGPRSGVFAEPSVLPRATHEFAEVEAMIDAGESLYGPYRWGRYDILVLPPSFPFGGMENPRLTFATPTILAGDRSLVSLIAHELAHSWSGNLVTNATWSDLWLNEGFTTYFERRIMERLRGVRYAEMLWALGLGDLREDVEDLGADNPDTALQPELAGRNPDDAFSDVPYEKGALLLRFLEERVGREAWDAFLSGYFARFAFQSMTTAGFLQYLRQELLAPRGLRPGELDLRAWIDAPGMPERFPSPDPVLFRVVDEARAAWQDGASAAELDTSGWVTQQWLHFLHGLPEDLPATRMAELDSAFGFTDSGNSEIVTAWLELAVRNGYHAADERLEEFLLRVGRRKFLEPLYSVLATTPSGRQRALEIYRRARPGYHAITTATLDRVLGWTGEA